MGSDIQLLEETLFIERIGSLFLSQEIQKNADLQDTLSGMLGPISSSIKSGVQSQIHGKDSGGTVRTILNLLAPAVFFKIHPLLGAVVTGAELLGFDIYSIYEKIISDVKPKIESGTVTANDINQSAVSASGAPVQASYSYIEGFLIKQAKSQPSIESFFQGLGLSGSQQSASPGVLGRVFGTLPKKTGLSLLTGIVGWFIKMILISAGLLTAGGLVMNMFGKSPVSSDSDSKEEKEQTVQQRNTGKGSEEWKKKPGDLWIESLDGQKPFERILDWTYESYPELSQYKDIILRTPSFWDAVSKAKGNWHGENDWSVQDPFKRKDDVLNLFVNDVFKTINQG